MRFPLTSALLLLLVSLVFVGCRKETPYKHYDGAVWGTTFHITYQSDRVLDDSIVCVMSRVENSLSPFSDSSLVTAINENRTCVTDTLFRRIFTAAQLVNRQSGGAYDPTVLPLVELWGFGRNRNISQEPDSSAIALALHGVGIGFCKIDGAKVIKRSPDTRFDFSSITKGYGCDLVGEMLKRNGCKNFMVEIGGEMSLQGVNSRGLPWRVMVEAPVDNDTTTARQQFSVIDITNCGIATSGNYRNFHDFKSGRKGHTISPVTGYPVTTHTLSATVVAPNAMLADALATACMALPADKAMAMIAKFDNTGAMLIVIDDSTGGWRTITTPGFPKSLR